MHEQEDLFTRRGGPVCTNRMTCLHGQDDLFARILDIDVIDGCLHNRQVFVFHGPVMDNNGTVESVMDDNRMIESGLYSVFCRRRVDFMPNSGCDNPGFSESGDC